MVLPLNLLSKETRLRKQSVFLEYQDLASVRNHPAFNDILRPWYLPMTRDFVEDKIMADMWNKSDIRPAVKLVAQRLDEEWPEWAATRTNVFGLLLSDLFARFMPWLESLPIYSKSADVGVRFERHFFMEAESRHTLEFWCKANSPPPGWFHIATKGSRPLMYAGNPVLSGVKSKGVASWRCYHKMMMSEGSWQMVEAIPEGGWVYI